MLFWFHVIAIGAYYLIYRFAYNRGLNRGYDLALMTGDYNADDFETEDY